jgi:hypothetical protein
VVVGELDVEPESLDVADDVGVDGVDALVHAASAATMMAAAMYVAVRPSARVMSLPGLKR